MSGQVRLSLIERESPDLSITQQCALMGIGRSSLCDPPALVAPETLETLPTPSYPPPGP